MKRFDPKLEHAVAVIKSSFNDTVEVKDKDVHKFGACITFNTATAHTVFTAQDSNSFNETYITANAITHVVTSGTTVGQTLRIEGHVITGSASSFKVQNVVENGQVPVALDTPLWRVSRAAEVGSETLDGRFFVFEGTAVTGGVPDDSSKTHLVMDTARNQSEKAATTWSDQDYALVTGIWCALRRAGGGSTGNADITFEVRQFGGVFQEKFVMSLARTGTSSLYVPADPYFILPPNSDVRIRAVGDAVGISIVAGFSCYLAIRTVPKS